MRGVAFVALQLPTHKREQTESALSFWVCTEHREQYSHAREVQELLGVALEHPHVLLHV